MVSVSQRPNTGTRYYRHTAPAKKKRKKEGKKIRQHPTRVKDGEAKREVKDGI
jgi:hypothetical protein